MFGFSAAAAAQVGPKNGDTWRPVLPKPVSSVPPQTPDPLTIDDVVIDKEAENSVVAREKALEAIPALAFQKFVEANMGAEAAKTVAVPKDIAALVADFEVSGEQMSSTRYIGKYTVRFRDGIRNYVTVKEPETIIPAQEGYVHEAATATDPAATVESAENAADPAALAQVERDIPSAAAASAPVVAFTDPLPRHVLVLPYFENAAGQTVLWEDPNPWRDVWVRSLPPMPENGTQFFVPLGDISDMAAGPVNSVWSGDYAMVERLRRNYSAGAVALLVATRAEKTLGVDVYLYQDGKLSRRGSIHPYVGTDVAGGWHQALSGALEYLRRAPVSRAKSPSAPQVEQISRDIVGSYSNTTTIIDSTGARGAGVNSSGGSMPKPSPQQTGAPYAAGQQQAVYTPASAAAAPVPDVNPITGAYSPRTLVDAEMRFQQLSAWTEMQRRLSGLDIDIKSLSAAGASFAISFDGPPGALRSALAARGVAMDGPYPGGGYSVALSN